MHSKGRCLRLTGGRSGSVPSVNQDESRAALFKVPREVWCSVLMRWDRIPWSAT
jgi:hypothetical protein